MFFEEQFTWEFFFDKRRFQTQEIFRCEQKNIFIRSLNLFIILFRWMKNAKAVLAIKNLDFLNKNIKKFCQKFKHSKILCKNHKKYINKLSFTLCTVLRRVSRWEIKSMCHRIQNEWVICKINFFLLCLNSFNLKLERIFSLTVSFTLHYSFKLSLDFFLFAYSLNLFSSFW